MQNIWLHSYSELIRILAQTVKNVLSVRETWVQSLGWVDPLEEGMATHSSILAWRIPLDRGAWWAIVHGVARVRHDLATEQQQRRLLTSIERHIESHFRSEASSCWVVIIFDIAREHDLKMNWSMKFQIEFCRIKKNMLNKTKVYLGGKKKLQK